MKNAYKYLIAFCYSGGMGSIHITTEQNIKSFGNIKKIEEYIRQSINDEQASVVNYTLVRKCERKRKFIK